MKILIVDDEKPARDRLRRLLDGLSDYNVVAEAANGMEAIQHFNGFQPDIVLLDIRMPVMDGLETAQHLMTHEQPPAIIFITAYEDHALQAFETHAVDYLLKPVRRERLEAALYATRRLSRAQQRGQLEALNDHDPDSNSPRTHICVRKRGNLELVPIDDIYYFMAEHKYVTLKHRQGEALIEESLVNLEYEFAQHFVRVHRNALVCFEKLSGLQKRSDGSHVLTFMDIDTPIEISRRHLPAVRKLLKH